MMHEPLVSVVIPVFNGERFIENALASVFKQTYKEIEIIVVNDGSTDKTIEHLDKYRGKIKIISIRNSGTPSVPRNIGIAEAKGEYIAFLDSDDIWQPFKLQHCISALEKNLEVGCLFSDFNRFEWHDMSFYALSNSQIFPFIYEEIRSFKWFEYKYFRIVKEKMFILLLRGYPIYPSTMIGRKNLLKKINWNENLYVAGNEDFDINLKFCEYTDFIYVDDKLVNIGRHDKNVSIDFIEQKEGDLRVLNNLDKKKDFFDKKIIRYYKGKRLCGLGYNYLMKGQSTKARKKYAEAMKVRSIFFHAFLRYFLSYFR